eukprot:symbB.v1.2.014032.t1/scaffold994.1/size146050/8
MQSAMQLTITIPEGAAPGSILSIPVKGRPENVKATVPEGYGPGDELVLMQLAGTDRWVEESVLKQAEQDAANAVFGEAVPTENLVPPGVSFPEDADLGPLMPSGPVAHTVRLETTIGTIDIIVRPDWAPYGARRFLQLAYCGDLDGLAFYRAVRGCLAQFGLPAKRQWPPLPDDPKTGVPFLLGAVCFAAAGENSRKSTLFICTGDMSHCFGGSPWETPIGAVAEVSLDVLERIETCYGDIAECDGTGPDTGRIHAEGNAYLMNNFPKLTYIQSAQCLDWPLGRGAGSELPMGLPSAAPAEPSPAAYTTSMQQEAFRGKAASSGIPISTGPCAAPMVQSMQVQSIPVPRAQGMSYTLPADRPSFELHAQQQTQMLLAAAAAKPGEAHPVTTSSSVQLVPAAFPNGYVPGRGGSYVPPPVAMAQGQPGPLLSPQLGMPAMGPPLGHPGLCSPSLTTGPCSFPCPGPCGAMPGVRPRGSSLQAPPAVPASGPGVPLGFPGLPSMPNPLSPTPNGLGLGTLGSLGSLRPMAPGSLGPSFSGSAGPDTMQFNFQGLQMPQLQMPTLGSLPGPTGPGMPQMPQVGRPDAQMFRLGGTPA